MDDPPFLSPRRRALFDIKQSKEERKKIPIHPGWVDQMLN